LLLLIFFGCKEKFEPNLKSISETYLVVDGVLNAGSGSTSIRLTRSFKLDRTAELIGELNAKVTVEGKDNSTRQLTSGGSGYYVSAGLNLSVDQDYRLRIKTVDGKEYLSEYVTARLTPPVDSIGWHRTQNNGVQFYVNTSDPSNKTLYYRWEYEETWEIHSFYYSRYRYVDTIANSYVLERKPSELVNICWRYHVSSNILLGSSVRLQNDRIFEAPLVLVSRGDDKLAIRYSILLRQYSLDKAGYEFYDLLRKNTESLGTIFDAQPSQIRGNITCTSDPSQVVIGYITARTVQEKRIFVTKADIPDWKFVESCPTTQVPPDSIDLYFGALGLGPYEASTRPNGSIEYYLGADQTCVDCTKRGGSVIKPSYW
ncbi:MAG TPA: DUF4249 domain-containing protein, partial [Chitinophagaceae bacterium]|nr:DUF4249 domain-containing protein [Chitinophagaceae bacterium]